jgi:hypothetical protein
MDDKVGRMPDAATVAALLTTLRGVVETWRPYGINLSADERSMLLHARRGAEPHIARIADIAAKYSFAIPDVPIQGMRNDLALWTMLRPFQDAFAAGLVFVDDTAAQAQHEAWQAFLAYYAVLGGVAPHQPAIGADLAPTVAFMANGRRSPEPAVAPAPAAPAPAPAAEAPAKKKARRALGTTAMQNLVGDRVPDQATQDKLLADTEGVVSAWRPYGLVLTGAQRLKNHHPRHGAEPHIARIHDIAVKYGIALDGAPLQGMLDDLALHAALRPFQDALRAGHQFFEDTAGTAESEAWEAFLAYYGALNGMAQHHAGVEEDMKPIVDFMKNGPRKPPTQPKG